MNELKAMIQVSGLIGGIKLWTEVNIKWKIQQFIWLNVTHKPYCLNCGWDCDKDCKDKLTKREDILKHFEEIHKEISKVERGKKGLCAYCEEEKGTEIIPNPNISELSNWEVCKTCKDILKYQQQLNMGVLLGNEGLVEEANLKLEEISKKSGKRIFNTSITKEQGGYTFSSVEFGKE